MSVMRFSLINLKHHKSPLLLLWILKLASDYIWGVANDLIWKHVVNTKGSGSGDSGTVDSVSSPAMLLCLQVNWQPFWPKVFIEHLTRNDVVSTSKLTVPEESQLELNKCKALHIFFHIFLKYVNYFADILRWFIFFPWDFRGAWK